MAKSSVDRKLRAILSADVKGYSRMMGEDEVGTYQTLTANLESIRSIISEHKGRVFSSPGDAVMAEFSSVVDAVKCAVELQEKIEGANAEAPEDRKMQFRIGVNLGDVIHDGEQVYGDGVNIAARIETLAEPGRVSISKTVCNHVQNKLNFGYEYQGEHQVKNISKAVKVYKVLTAPEHAGQLIGEPKSPKRLSKQSYISIFIVLALVVAAAIWQFYPRAPEIEPASVENMAYPLPEKPSIAVLPFDNMSEDPKQEYFSDGITEDIITTLSKIDELFVIARNSTFTYKGKPVKVKQVAEELGVRYVLEGSVRKSEDRVRITAQLIDAVAGNHLWAERYDRDLKDIFALQDEITMKIVTALQVKLTEGDQVRVFAKQYKTLDVKLKAMELESLWRKGTVEGHMRHGQVAQELIDMAPETPVGYNSLGWYYWYLAMSGKSPQESIAKAFKLAQKALSMDESNPFTYALLSNLYVMMRQYDKAIAAGERGVALNPNGAINYVALGIPLSYAGKLDEAIGHFKQGIRLDPFPKYYYFTHLGRCYMHKKQYKEALSEFKKALHVSGDTFINNMHLAAIYALLERQEEASAAAKKVLEMNPKFSVKRFSKAWPYKNQADLKLVVDALHKAGLPDKPPLPMPDKPSIAVLAFDNLSGDPEQEYFSDGISENIITALSKVGDLFVIARNSSFTFKGKPVKIQKVGRELGVRYVLEGSVRRSGDKVRITAQLIDAKNGQHIWAENYDRDFKNIFKIQDEITLKIITSLQVKLTEGEHIRITVTQFKNPAAYYTSMLAISHFRKGTKEGIIKYGQLAQEIVDMEPKSPVGYRRLAWYHLNLVYQGLSPRENLKKAFNLSQKALSIDENDGFSHSALGMIYLMMRKYEKAIASGKRAVELQPNGAQANFHLGSILSYADRVDEGIAFLKQAFRLNPFPAYYYYYDLGRSYRQKGQYEDALVEFQKALQRAPDAFLLHATLAVTYILLDREDEARASASKALELMPNFSVANFLKTSRYKNQAHTKLIADAMRKAGFPE